MRNLNQDIETTIEFSKERQRQARLETKIAVFEKYGGPVCACCGEACVYFLSVDHIFNDGAAHRKQLKETGCKSLYAWLKKNNYPSGFQVLCMNCNMGKYLNGGVCPHHGIC
jgi:hypothetical protein